MDEQALLQLGREILAPVLGTFTQWVLGRALEDGVLRLYFLSRDGYYPWRQASALCRAWDLPLDCRYLYGSRYAWRLPMFHRDPAGMLAQLVWGGARPSLEDVLAQAGLTPKEQGAVRAALGNPRRLPRREELLACPAFFRAMEWHSRQALPAFVGYLRQEGLLDGVPWALVDSGWMGSTQGMLEQALRLLGWRGRLQGYYAGLYRSPRAGNWNGCFFHPGRELDIQLGFEPGFFEAVFAPAQAMTLGYRRQGEGFLPVLGEAVPSRERKLLAQVFQSYGEELASSPRPAHLLDQVGKEFPSRWKALRQLMIRPTGRQALALGGMAFSPGMGKETPRRLAPRLTEKELKENCLLSRLLGRPAQTSPWLPGSAALLENPGKWFQAFDRARGARVLSLAAKEVSSWQHGKNSGNIGL